MVNLQLIIKIVKYMISNIYTNKVVCNVEIFIRFCKFYLIKNDFIELCTYLSILHISVHGPS